MVYTPGTAAGVITLPRRLLHPIGEYDPVPKFNRFASSISITFLRDRGYTAGMSSLLLLAATIEAVNDILCCFGGDIS